MNGLKRVLFPLYEQNLPIAAVAAKRQVLAPQTIFKGDSLANLGQIVSVANKKERRTKRQRDKTILIIPPSDYVNQESKRDNKKDLLPSTRITVLMDSLASLGAIPCVPKTVSPPPVDSKRKRTKETSCAASKSKSKDGGKKADCTRVKKRKTKQPKGVNRNRTSLVEHSQNSQLEKKSSLRRAKPSRLGDNPVSTIVSTQATGLGAMFGITALPSRTGGVLKPKQIESQPIELHSRISPRSEKAPVKDSFGDEIVHLEPADESINSRKARSGKTVRKADGQRKRCSSRTKTSTSSTGTRTVGKNNAAMATSSKAALRRSKRQSKESLTTEHVEAEAETESCNTTMCGTKAEESSLGSSGKSPHLRRSKRRRSIEEAPYDANASGAAECLTERIRFHKEQEAGVETFIPPLAQESPDSNAVTIRRSKRSTAPPDRFGVFVDGSCEEIQSTEILLHPRTGSHKDLPAERGLKRQKSMVADEESATVVSEKVRPCPVDDDGWNEQELSLLRMAHQEVDSKSLTFWDEVADRVRSKTSAECRARWFSFAKTPAPPTRKPKKTNNEKTTAAREDDIFNATPMKAIFHLPETFGTAFNFGNLALDGIGSAIKVASVSHGKVLDSPLIQGKHGYKTYVKNVKRDMNVSERCRLPKAPRADAIEKKKTLSVKDVEGEYEVKGRLSPGGTLRVDTESIHTADAEDEDLFMMSEDDEHGGF